jgi:aspartyl-tRNA(Asn)/glutamyl-tRNA(Gln) amidotransferase subunit B
MKTFTPIIGMEVHVELRTQSKMFCGCSADHFSKAPNTQTCPVCLGLPGALPVPNATAITWAQKIGLALGCRLASQSKFDRKHYFYPDLPKGYQISQYDEPLCVAGKIATPEGEIRITRVHLEEDTGKLQHAVVDGQKVTLVDFNRGGVALVEIVTEPDIRSASQAKMYAQTLQQLLRYLDVSDADMEKGSMRLEANISLSTDGSLPNYKVEVKNLNSFRFLEKAIEYEMERQSEILQKGEIPAQETRGFSEQTMKTFSQRTKETSEDYRYFPDPDIPPLLFSKAELQLVSRSMPTLPNDYRRELKEKYQIREDYIDIVVSNRDLADFTLNTLSLAIKNGLKPERIVSIIINKKIGSATDPQEFIQSFVVEPKSTASSQEIEAWMSQSLTAHPELVEKYKAGKTSVIGAFIGDIMKRSKGQADPKTITALLAQKLAE